jgi:hypothetical protein
VSLEDHDIFFHCTYVKGFFIPSNETKLSFTLQNLFCIKTSTFVFYFRSKNKKKQIET